MYILEPSINIEILLVINVGQYTIQKNFIPLSKLLSRTKQAGNGPSRRPVQGLEE